MSEWFRTAFGEDYLSLYAHRNASEAELAVGLILEQTKLPEGSLVMDAPCGAGRHLAALRTRGMRAVGMDLSMALLTEAVGGAGQAGKVVRADLRALPFRTGQCDMAVNLFSSLGYFPTDDMNYDVLRSLVHLVRPGGWMVVDFMHSEHVRRNLQAESSRTTASGISVKDMRWIDGELPRVNKRTQLLHSDGREQILEESVRLFSPDELRGALMRFGVAVELEFGAYTGEDFRDDSSRIILMGRRG